MRTCFAIIVSSFALAGAAQAEPPRNAAGYYLISDDSATVPPPPAMAPRPPVAQAPVTPVRPPVVAQDPSVDLTPSVPDSPLAQAQPDAHDSQAASPHPPRVLLVPPDEPVFTITGNQLAAIGVGVIGGMILLDGLVGLPAAAFVGGLAGQWYYTNNIAPDDEYRVNRRATGQQWQTAVVRDGTAAIGARYMVPIRDEGYAR